MALLGYFLVGQTLAESKAGLIGLIPGKELINHASMHSCKPSSEMVGKLAITSLTVGGRL